MTNGKGEIVVHEEARAFLPMLEVRQAVERFQALAMFVREVMREGLDFGTIPGTPKPTLYKPGAEKLCTLFGLTCRFEIVHKIEDWDGHPEPLFYYQVRCKLSRGDLLIAEADASCNSREGRYRWRWAQEDQVPSHLDKATLGKRGGVTSEFSFAVEKGETSGQYGKPAEYWQTWRDAIADGRARSIKRKSSKGNELDAWEMDSTVYRIPNDDIATLVNTILKMSEKRALVAATLIAVNASEFFTQDIEDLDLPDIRPVVTIEPPPRQPVSSGDWNVPCQDCGGGIESWGDHTPRAVADTRRDRYGRALCEKCAKEEKARRQAAKEDAIEGEYRQAEKAAVS